MKQFDVLIVGSGHSGAQVAIALRHQKFDGSIAILGDEVEYPYERPPLSKEYLAGDKSFERVMIRPANFWSEREITMLLGQRVEKVHPDAHNVILSGGESIGYSTLIWAAGGRPRMLSCAGTKLAGVHVVRTRRDVDQMMTQLPNVRRVVVIGGGYIGLEVAAVLNKLGKHVILLEALDRVLARVAGEPISRFYEKEHRARGVDLRTSVVVKCIEGEGGNARGVRLAGDELLAASMVIVGIGIVPAVEPLRDAGAEVGNGVHVDSFCRTSLTDIFAIGDCAAHESTFAGKARIRLESVQNACDQASVVASAIVGTSMPYSATPWFWSNQYDLKLQTVGLSIGYDDMAIRGDPMSRSFSVIYLKAGRVIALDCINLAKDYVQGKKLVEAGAVVEKTVLENTTIPLKSMIGLT